MSTVKNSDTSKAGSRKKKPASNETTKKIFGVVSIIISLFLLFSFVSYFFTWEADFTLINKGERSFYSFLFDMEDKSGNIAGKLGLWVSYVFITRWFGVASVLFAPLLFTVGVGLLDITKVRYWKISRYILFWLVWISVASAFAFKNVTDFAIGGYFGLFCSDYLVSLLGPPGTILLLLVTLCIYLLVGHTFFSGWIDKMKTDPEARSQRREVRRKEREERQRQKKLQKEERKKSGEQGEQTYNVEEFAIGDELEIIPQPVARNEVKQDEIEIEIDIHQPEAEPQVEIADVDETPLKHIGIETPYDPTLDLSDYRFPTLDLLKDYGDETAEVNAEELNLNKKRIVEVLNHFDIAVVSMKATIGPTVTLYEIVPAQGIRISKIKNLEDNIALSLAALGIRIIAPIPGKGTIGIEVPNSNPSIVSMRAILSSERFQTSKFALPIAFGKTIANETYVADLAKMPHLLMAGATGQGKSVGINAVIASLLYKKHPAELKFVMIDPKKVELTLFSKIERHYLAKLPNSEDAIITDTQKVVYTLKSLIIEMDNRYELLKDAQVRDMQSYNAKFIQRQLNPLHGHRYLPYIVLVIDEFADLIMTAGKEIERPIARLAQLSRAVGIHLIIATQRPSVNIITGVIKANFPARLAFRVTAKVDSRTILDTGGADQLIGRGDMLLSTGSDVIRLQCAFIDSPEVEVLTEYIGSQRAYPTALLLPEVEDEAAEVKEFDESDRDPLFKEAATVVVETQQGSASMLQRKLKLGYNRAGRLIDQLEATGIVGPFEGSKAREVRVKTLDELESFNL
ncbi:MAG: DNA translocase FtsK [Bacteroidales bacterium]|nr:DNA translocase FtsK [Bacteroidales bacterium]